MSLPNIPVVKSPESRRRWLRQTIALAAITPGGVSGLIREALANGNAPITPGIIRLKGDVRLNGEAARVGLLVKTGDTLHTGAGAEVIYVIDQDAYLQREKTSVSFGGDSAKKLMRIITGKILSVFGKGERSISVSTATLGIRGTACYIEDEPGKDSPQVSAGETAISAIGDANNGKPSFTPRNTQGDKKSASRTYFCLCYGEVDLTPIAAPKEHIRYRTEHHDHPLYIHDDMAMPTMMVDAPVMNHSDAELRLLEALVGRTPPFVGSGKAY
jgi:hypothetical protein